VFYIPIPQTTKPQDHKNFELFVEQLKKISPSNLTDDCRLVVDARERRLCSTVSQTCVVTQTYNSFGDRAFPAVGHGLLTVFHHTWKRH